MSEPIQPSLTVPSKSSTVFSCGWFFLISALLILVVATALRVHHLGERSLWFDEALTANTSRTTLTHMLEATRIRGSAPVVHPFILYLVERVSKSAVVVRAPSVLASLLAIMVILGTVRAKVDPYAALFAAAILAISASQIRYAQEVREYSLSVLLATLLIYCLLRWEAVGTRSRHPVLLYLLLFMAPLVQYGLVFLASAILGTITLRIIFAEDVRFRWAHLMVGSLLLGVGGLLSYAITLRYQFHPSTAVWYLLDNYYDPSSASLLHFVGTNSKAFLTFAIPGHLIARSFGVAAIIFCVWQLARRRITSITLLVLLSLTITISAAALRLYPFGGIRQCLFLTPGLILFAGVVFAEVLKWTKGSIQPAVASVFMILIVVSGYRGMLGNRWPYAEYEDTRTILEKLAVSAGPNDQVWVNHDAVEAVDFYLQGKDSRFIYGRYHKNPQEYIPELLDSIDLKKERTWLVFSHLQQPSDLAEEQLIVGTLRSEDWDVRSVVAPTNTQLFIARKQMPPQAILIPAR